PRPFEHGDRAGALHQRHHREDARDAHPPEAESPRSRPGGRARLSERALRRVAEAVDRVVVDEPDGLHERVADGRPDEAKAALLQVLAYRPGLGCLRRDLAERPPLADDRLAVDEAPEIGVEAASVGAHLEHALRVVHRRLDLQPVADDARVLEQAVDVALREPAGGARAETA